MAGTWSEELGFRLHESAAQAGIDFRHRAPTLDPGLRNVEPHIAGLGASISVTDVDGDGWPDLYFTNSAFGAPNALYLNGGDGTFRDVASEAGLADLNREGEGVSIRLAADHHVPYLRPLYYSPPILALFFVGPVAMWWDLRRKARASSQPFQRGTGR